MAEVMHVKLDDSIKLRKTILSAAIDSARLIKQKEEIKGLRENKLDKINNFNNKIKQIKTYVNKLKSELPIVMGAKEVEKEQEREEKPLKKRLEKKELTEIDRLSSEIEQLESKLRML